MESGIYRWIYERLVFVSLCAFKIVSYARVPILFKMHIYRYIVRCESEYV